MLRVDHFSDILIAMLSYHLQWTIVYILSRKLLSSREPTHYLRRNGKFVWFACFTKCFGIHSVGLSLFLDCHLDRLRLMELDALGLDFGDYTTGLVKLFFVCYPKNNRQVINQPGLLQVSKMFHLFAATCRTWDLCSPKPKDTSKVTSAGNLSGTFYTWRASCPGSSPQSM